MKNRHELKKEKMSAFLEKQGRLSHTDAGFKIRSLPQFKLAAVSLDIHKHCTVYEDTRK